MPDINPWDLRTESDRTADTRYTFIIFCEDEVSEPCYLRQFQKPHLKINIIPGQSHKKMNVEKAITYCRENDLIENIDNVPTLKLDIGTQVWCVFDRDIEANADKVLIGHTSFDTSINTARSAKINIAWSNDAFELWLLLHFEDVVLNDPDYSHRQKYYERLTAIFKNLTFTPEYQKVVDSVDFNYKESMKKAHKFIPMVLPNLKGKTETAIARAKALAEHHHATPSFHEMAPCTMMHKLVEELIKLA
jgi:hypothetical protein